MAVIDAFLRLGVIWTVVGALPGEEFRPVDELVGLVGVVRADCMLIGCCF